MGKKTSKTPAITINEKSVGLWYLQLSNTQDWIAHLARTEEPNLFEIILRFRYYDPTCPDPFSGKDRRSWYRLRFVGDTSRAIEKTREMAAVLAKASNGHLDEILVQNADTNKFLMDIMSMPWAHTEKSGIA